MERVRQKIYCEIDFLLKFFEERPRGTSSDVLSEDEEFSLLEIWIKYRNIFFKNAVIYLNISQDQFFQNSHPFLNELKKRKGDGEIKLKFNQKPFENFDEVDSHSLFFLADYKKCEELEEKYGMLFISNEDYIKRADILFSSSTFYPISSDTDWNILSSYKHPCSNLTLIDNYLFSNRSLNLIRTSLFSLLKALLPEKLKCDFKLTIIAKKDENQRELKIDNGNSVEKSIISDIIKSLNLKYKVDVKFIPVRYSQHDRYILTNYYLFDCGYGFVLDTTQKSKGTHLHINRITQHGVLNTITELEEKLKILS